MEPAEYEMMAAVEDRHWWYSGMRAIYAAWLDATFPGRSDLDILDAGCGTGGNGDFLRRYGRPVGLDLAREALVLGQRRLPGRILGGSVVELPFAASTFDLVTSFDVLYHRAVIDERAALRETWRVLKPGGSLLIRLPAYRWLSGKHDRAVHTRHRYTAREVRQALANTNFAVERLSYVNSVLFPVPLIQRTMERIVPWLERPGSDLTPPGRLTNTLLRSVLESEAAWLRRGGTFAWGLSVLCLARKPVVSSQ
ncbi:MAG: methyltransferase domain-containing protein [Chloroflexota bacterium]|nr:methyltransferase domain-containing protein [Chloroflexota bacterium]